MKLPGVVELSEQERTNLETLITGGTIGARKLKRALTLRMRSGSC